MHAPAPAPPQYRPSAAGVVLLRVLFVAVTVCSLGLLAWAAMLRAALVQRRPLGWWLFGADLAVLVTVCVLVLSYPETDWRTNLAVGALLLQMMAAVAYYLVIDTTAVRPAAAGQPHGPAHPAYGPPTAYPAGPPPTAPPSPAYGTPQHANSTRPYVNSYAEAPAQHDPHQARPHPQRIHQVRAELEELSDYLHREEGR
ncbi:hypothetical protein [Streptomyces sp. 3N207]|uniref:hypothetical protein n=1 Tax=Streptomyces sp. 3N207 TaxID=3457417 RepID=UPI003FD323B3